jgi:hypothetical protein
LSTSHTADTVTTINERCPPPPLQTDRTELTIWNRF